MIKTDDFNTFLKNLYKPWDFDDYCVNGLVLKGFETIERVALGVSLNMELIKKAIHLKADAIVVHHGFFGKDFFHLNQGRKEKIKLLIENGISLFSYHLPMDVHPEIGHNSLILKEIGISDITPMGYGYRGVNTEERSIKDILAKLEAFLVSGHVDIKSSSFPENPFNFGFHGPFRTVLNGPEKPVNIAVISGEGSSEYLSSVENNNIDTFITGAVKEHIPALSLETSTNYIDLGHYFSEKPGLFALRDLIEKELDLSAFFIDIFNPV